MPTYEYRCESCGRSFDVVQGFHDSPLTTCEECGGSLRKVFAAVGIVFKGSGFYKTDSRTSSKRSSSANGKDGASSDAPAKEPAAATSGDAAPSASSSATTPPKSEGTRDKGEGPSKPAPATTPSAS